MAWRWNARRLIVSAFVLLHLSAVCVWLLPPCYIKDHVQDYFRYYILPSGMWQWWAIFAPDPIRDTVVLDAEIVDGKGMRHIFEFPRLANLPWWQKMPLYRQPKFVGNMQVSEYFATRKFVARYAVRQMEMQSAPFPLSVSLYYKIKDSPPPGATAASDPMTPPRIQVIERFEFASAEELKP